MIAGELKDPRIGFVTVTRVELAADLRNARVFVGILGTPEERKKSLAGLQAASGFLRRALGQSLRLRYTPELSFKYDEGLEHTDRVARLLDEIHQAPTSGSTEDDDE